MANSLPYRVLVIDDDPIIHACIRKALQSETQKVTASQQAKFPSLTKKKPVLMPLFEVDFVFQGKDGVDLVLNSIAEERPYALSFIDIRMPPGWDGIETIRRIWEIDHDIQIVICTAHSDYSWAEMVQQLGTSDGLLILKKPFNIIEIRQLACSLTKKWDLARQISQYLDSLESQVSLRTAQIMATLESTTDGILSLGSEQTVLNFNQKLVDLWELPDDLLSNNFGNNFLQFIAQKLQDEEQFNTTINDLKINPDATSFDVLKTKDEKIIECYSQPQKIGGRYQGRVWSFRDITKSKELENRLAYQLTHDSLTGLPNRALLYDRIQLAIANANNSKTSFAILFFNIDRFKLINDLLGHNAGDELLKEISKRLKSCIRESDTLARLGGDEFVIVISYLKKEEGIIPIVQSCLASLALPFVYKKNQFHLTARVGISLFPKDGEESQILLKHADMAMGRAKEMKPVGFRFYTNDLNARADERLLLEANLRQALENKQFELYYQPQIDLHNGVIIGAEALLRWHHPKLGLISPLKFISIAEEIGLIVPIGEWVCREACKQYRIWQQNGLPAITLAINLSAQQVKQNNFVSLMHTILLEAKMDPENLEFEFTESCLMDDVESIIPKIISLKKLGVSLAIDDFGTGYSSLSYLKMFPIDKIKIDQSFIHGLSTNLADKNIITAIIAMAKSLNLKALAEGIETEEQLSFLQQQGCNQGQGYLFSRPLNGSSFTQMLKGRNV